VTPDTLFQVGSISKTFTATALMMLRDAGKVDLDTPIRAYLPDFRLSDEEVAARVTLKHLLTHTGGWLGDYFNDFGFGDDAQARMLKEIAKLPQFTPLGEVWSYCNTGFNIAGRIVEVITGRSYEAAIKEMILDPLGLSMTFYFPHDVMTYRFAAGHEIVDRSAKVARPWPIGRAGHPVGGVVSTVIDLLKYARFHMSAGSGLLKPETIKLMQTPIVTGSGLDVFGLSWFTSVLLIRCSIETCRNAFRRACELPGGTGFPPPRFRPSVAIPRRLERPEARPARTRSIGAGPQAKAWSAQPS